jgi:hypothetical protein
MLLPHGGLPAGASYPEMGEEVPPSPAALIESLRSIGYTPETAVADVIDNSIAAGATNISLHFDWQGSDSTLTILDNGRGMDKDTLLEALRLGSKPAGGVRRPDDLGRFGLGLKTATFSQCRKLTVWTKTSGGSVLSRCWDLDHVAVTGCWQLRLPLPDDAQETKLSQLASGTIVQWQVMDRFLGSGTHPDKTHFWAVAKRISQHLSMVFHRYLSAEGKSRIKISINDRLLEAFDPFLSSNLQTGNYSSERHPNGTLTLRPFILPPIDNLPDKIRDAAAGPLGWEAHQGFFVYRNRRLLVSGGWLGLAKVNPAFNRVRIQLDLNTSADADWQVDVLKSRATAPRAVREFLNHISSRVRALATQNNRVSHGARGEGEASNYEPVWLTQPEKSARPFLLNRAHPVLAQAMNPATIEDARVLLKLVLGLIENTAPLSHWVDNQPETASSPPADADQQDMLETLQSLYGILTRAGRTPGQARDFLNSAEPYSQYPHLISQL